MSLAKGALYTNPSYSPLAPLTNAPMPNATLVFWLSRTSGQLQFPATIYQDGNLTTPYASNVVTANSQGQFPPIYLSQLTPLRVQLFDQTGSLKQDVDIYNPAGRFLQAAVVGTTEVQTSNTTLQLSPNLQMALPSAGTYRFELTAEFALGGATGPNLTFGMFLEGGGSSANQFNQLSPNGGLGQDVQFLPGYPAMLEAAVYGAQYQADPGGAGGSISTRSVYGGAVVQSVGGYATIQSATNNTPLRITGIVTVTMPCTLGFAWCQASSSATSLSLVAGSCLVVEAVSQPVALLSVSGAASTSTGSITASALPVSFSSNTDSASFTTASCAVTVASGSGNYTYAWALSGADAAKYSVTSPSGQHTTFTATGMVAGTTYVANATCTVTDNNTGASAQVVVALSTVCNAALTLSLSPASLSSTGTGTSQTTGTVTATPGGGTGSYTEAWSFIAGGSLMIINSPTSLATTVTGTGMTRGTAYTGTLQCKLTDTGGSSITKSIPVTINCQLIATGVTVTLGTLVNSRNGRAFTGYWTQAQDPSGNTLAAGSMSNATDQNGHSVLAIYETGGTQLVVKIGATVTQAYLGSITLNGVTFSGAAAGFNTSGGVSAWTWLSVTTPWADNATGTKSVTSP